MNATACHVDGFDLRRRERLYRVEVTFAYREVILHDLPERPQRQVEFGRRAAILGPHVKDKALVANRQANLVGPVRRDSVVPVGQAEGILLHQVEHGDLALLFDLGRGRRKVPVVQFD